MPTFTRQGSCLLAAAVLLSGCGDVQSFLGNKKARYDGEPAPKKLEQIALSLDESEYRERCDDTFGPIRREISRVLDQRMDEILEVMATPVPDSKIEGIPAGPVLINKLTEKPASVDKWETSVESWKVIEQIYNEIRNTPTDRRWVGLNSYVRSILLDDRSRVLNGVNFYLTRADFPVLPQVKEALDACEADQTCLQPAFSPDAAALVSRNLYYQQFAAKLTEGSDNRKYITRWKKWVDFDLADSSFIKNDSLTVPAGSTTLVVQMNAGALGGYESILSSIIEPVWSQHGITVDIDWVGHANVFSIVVNEDIGGRAFVRYKDKTMNVADGVRDTTIAHEFGHILGLPDEYYTVWNRDTCEYTYETNAGNIMSQSSSGAVTPAHAEKLKGTYVP